MKENTNGIIVYNTFISYLRLIITAISAFFTTRFALQALGVVDYGLFSVLGSIISFIAIINTIMVSSSHRYIAVAVGKGDTIRINEIFNVNLLIHVLIAIFTILVAIPVGEWYISNYINYDGNLDIAKKIFIISVVASVISFVGVPFHALLMAKEKFIVFSLTDILMHIFKLLAVIMLVYFFEQKLIIYACIMAITTILPTLVYISYCYKKYKNITKLSFVRDISMYKDVVSFSLWVALGAFATVAKTQGSAVIINAFFTTIMNTALGIANTVNALLTMFTNNITKPIAPQITKSFASADYNRCNQLMVVTSKFAFLMILLISSPFLIETEFLLNLWLGNVPKYSVLFTRLIIINAILDSMNFGISEAIFASGKIKIYQIVISTISLLSVVVSFLFLKYGAPAQVLLYIYIIFTIINIFVRQIILHKILNFDNLILIKGAYLPSLCVLSLFIIYYFFLQPETPFINIIVCFLFLFLVIWSIGMNRKERKYIFSLIRKIKK